MQRRARRWRSSCEQSHNNAATRSKTPGEGGRNNEATHAHTRPRREGGRRRAAGVGEGNGWSRPRRAAVVVEGAARAVVALAGRQSTCGARRNACGLGAWLSGGGRAHALALKTGSVSRRTRYEHVEKLEKCAAQSGSGERARESSTCTRR